MRVPWTARRLNQSILKVHPEGNKSIPNFLPVVGLLPRKLPLVQSAGSRKSAPSVHTRSSPTPTLPPLDLAGVPRSPCQSPSPGKPVYTKDLSPGAGRPSQRGREAPAPWVVLQHRATFWKMSVPFGSCYSCGCEYALLGLLGCKIPSANTMDKAWAESDETPERRKGKSQKNRPSGCYLKPNAGKLSRRRCHVP